jgi:hypothetical protein
VTAVFWTSMVFTTVTVFAIWRMCNK